MTVASQGIYSWCAPSSPARLPQKHATEPPSEIQGRDAKRARHSLTRTRLCTLVCWINASDHRSTRRHPVLSPRGDIRISEDRTDRERSGRPGTDPRWQLYGKLCGRSYDGGARAFALCVSTDDTDWRWSTLQGVLFGIGQSLCFFAAATLPSSYFLKKRASASDKLNQLIYCTDPIARRTLRESAPVDLSPPRY